jgi:calcineurin-like phosphoesterase family protein
MIEWKGKEYTKIWFTSDEHYGSDRHISLSKRLDFDNYLKYTKAEYIELKNATDIPERIKKMVVNTEYGMMLQQTPVDKMCNEIITKHNMLVGENDLVIHIGDFGDYRYAERLNGSHILIMGNYEHNDMNDKYGGFMSTFRNEIIENYNFIDCMSDCTLTTELLHSMFSQRFVNEIGELYITHKPTDCKYNNGSSGNITPVICDDGRLVMNLFGHIHEKQKVKTFGLNCGVDTNHFYPVSQEEIEFYIYAILHYYDEDVFI